MSNTVIAIVVVLVGCGSPRARDPVPHELPPNAPAGSARTSIDAAVVEAAPNAASCPTTFAAGTGACSREAGGRTCNYAEGQCHCGAPTQCGGAVQQLDPNVQWFWQCKATPPKIRADGCPGSATGGPCTTEGKQCTYVDCCTQTYTCSKGEWKQTAANCPP